MIAERNSELETRVFELSDNPSDFEQLALDVFRFQHENNPVYREFCERLKVLKVTHLSDIPFLPISFFKTHQVRCGNDPAETVYMSSGTTGQVRSKHAVRHVDVYERSFNLAYTALIGNPSDQAIFALLPNYVEQGNSSLVYMVDQLIQKSGCESSGFYLNQPDLLRQRVRQAQQEGRQVVLIGVAYALLDLAESHTDLSGSIVIETGGMKGRRKELTKPELHRQLKEGLGAAVIYSEYGMTELLSQAYLKEDEWFECPNWLRICIREVNDPFTLLEDGQTGAINCIDLANLYSCSFIATDDLGLKMSNRFKILGRLDNSDIRGCNLLVNS